ncbi:MULTISPECIES: germination lipoprotein GerS-related protein [Clostridium]|uniref:Germination lipoprotein GerS-related protein n=1 Tax=Clostridium lapidicellarium TaxID=3240931 RepID=A0ABV4DX60_9CLOT|nr:germination lipoprotein GerS-related protein [uncultured Clostridium sp.]
MKKLLIGIAVVFFVLLTIFLFHDRDIQNTEKIIYYLKDLDSYSCNVNIKIKNDKQQISYSGRQYYDSRYGERFDLDRDRVIVYSGNRIFVKNTDNSDKYSMKKNFNSLFKFCFIGEYISLLYTNEKIDNSFKKINDLQYQVVHLDIPGNNKNINRAELYIDLKHNIPTYLKIFDSTGRNRIEVEYTDFKANVEMNADIFKIN